MKQDKETKTKERASQLAFMGGFAGFHNFYLGEWVRGFFKLMLALMVTMITIASGGVTGFMFIPLLIVGNLMRGTKISAMSQDKFDLRYNAHLFIRGSQTPPPPVEVANEIFKLNQLFEKGVINFEEFERRKQKLLE